MTMIVTQPSVLQISEWIGEYHAVAEILVFLAKTAICDCAQKRPPEQLHRLNILTILPP